MNIKHTLLAFLLLAALGGAYYFVQKQPAPEDTSAIPREDLFAFQPEDVQEFTLNVAGQPAATFRRLPGAPPANPATAGETAPISSPAAEAQWEIVAPADIAADSYQIQSFLDEFPNFKANPLTADASSPQAPAWSEYALDQPARSFEFKLKDGKTVRLDIGKENPAGYAKYARRSEVGPVLLLDTIDNKSLHEKTLFDLRDKRILPMDMNSATRMDLHFNLGSGGPSAEEVARARSLGLPVRRERITFTRDASGNWRLSEPALRTDIGGATYLATIVSGGLMKTIVEEKAGPLAKYGLDRPQIRLVVTGPSGNSAGKSELLVGKMEKQGEEEFFYAMTSLRPHVFTILRTVYDQINQDLEYYRNRYLFDFETANARSVEVSGAAVASATSGGPLRYDRRGENWVKPGTPEVKMKDAQVENFLNGVHAIRISTFTSDEPNRFAAYGLDKPWMSIKVTFGEGNRQETILFGRKADKFYAARQGEPSVYELSPAEPASMEDRLKELTAK